MDSPEPMPTPPRPDGVTVVRRPVTWARPVLVPVPFVPPPAPVLPVPLSPVFGDAGSPWRAAAELFLLLVVLAGAGLFWSGIAHRVRDVDERWLNIGGTFIIGVELLTAIALMLWLGRRPPASIGWRSDFLALDVGLGVGLTFVTIALLVATAITVAVFSPGLFAEMQKTPEAIQGALPRMHPAALVAMSVWIAVFEETLFRGFLLTRLRAIVRWWPIAVVLGAFVFAVPHYYEGRIAVGLIFLLGVGMGVVFVWRRSLVPVLVWHFLFNSIQLMMLHLGAPDWR